MPKFHLNAHNVWQNYSNLITLTFLDSSRQDLSNDNNLTGLSDICIFPLLWKCHHYDIVFCHMFSNLLILWNSPQAISLQNFNAVDCLAQVLQRGYKNTMMTSLWRHFIFLGFEISIFCETDHKLSTCQVSHPSVIWTKFYRGWYKTLPKTIMTSLWRHFILFGFQNCTFCRT